MRYIYVLPNPTDLLFPHNHNVSGEGDFFFSKKKKLKMTVFKYFFYVPTYIFFHCVRIEKKETFSAIVFSCSTNFSACALYIYCTRNNAGVFFVNVSVAVFPLISCGAYYYHVELNAHTHVCVVYVCACWYVSGCIRQPGA